ncbi:ATP-binding protein [Plantactinospora sp. GCM10030261]|uniref:ATP-binding protein n=1 Tax=Plantactinospora sp. GCM10030261 TaxID=3273420 RepID=UPI003606ABA7
MRRTLVGRDEEFDTCWRALLGRGSALVAGPTGIGKTALRREVVAEATTAGWLVLTCAPTESETTLPYAALADLLRALADRAAGLPRPRRVAAEAVLLARTNGPATW